VMAKSEMKSIVAVVVMMIMLGFSEEAKLSCPAQCGIDCVLANLAYPICFAACVAKCPKMSKGALQCISHCGVNKSINIDVGNTQTLTTLMFMFHISDDVYIFFIVLMIDFACKMVAVL